jgi:hypothetical protein
MIPRHGADLGIDVLLTAQLFVIIGVRKVVEMQEGLAAAPWATLTDCCSAAGSVKVPIGRPRGGHRWLTVYRICPTGRGAVSRVPTAATCFIDARPGSDESRLRWLGLSLSLRLPTDRVWLSLGLRRFRQ